MSILDALQQATEEDLDAIEKRIAELEAEREQLKAVQKILAAKFKPTLNKRESKTKLATKVYDLIAKEGPLPHNVLASRLGVSSQVINGCVNRNTWFKRNRDGDVEIAKQ